MCYFAYLNGPSLKDFDPRLRPVRADTTRRALTDRIPIGNLVDERMICDQTARTGDPTAVLQEKAAGDLGRNRKARSLSEETGAPGKRQTEVRGCRECLAIFRYLSGLALIPYIPVNPRQRWTRRQGKSTF